MKIRNTEAPVEKLDPGALPPSGRRHETDVAAFLRELIDGGWWPVSYRHVAEDRRADCHSHPFDQLLLVVSGQVVFRVPGHDPVSARAGERLLIPADAPHAVELEEGTAYVMGWNRLVPWEAQETPCPPDA
jgi:quercetin dioxygenase-like cupin family protein